MGYILEVGKWHKESPKDRKQIENRQKDISQKTCEVL